MRAADRELLCLQVKDPAETVSLMRDGPTPGIKISRRDLDSRGRLRLRVARQYCGAVMAYFTEPLRTRISEAIYRLASKRIRPSRARTRLILRLILHQECRLIHCHQISTPPRSIFR